jgi:hypothetical protein
MNMKRKLKKLEKKIDYLTQLHEDNRHTIKRETSLLEYDDEIENLIKNYIDLYIKSENSSNILLELEGEYITLRAVNSDNDLNQNKYQDPDYVNLTLCENYISINGTYFNQTIKMKSNIHEEYKDKLIEINKRNRKMDLKNNFNKMISIANLSREKAFEDLNIE